MPRTPLKTSVVIVTWNGWPYLAACLRSLRRQTRAPDEIVVVDNGSHDGTSERVGAAFPEVRLVAAGRNLGFAAGNNLGIERSTGEAVVLVNNDVVAEAGFIERVVAPLEESAAIGAVAATMVFSSDPSIVASAGINVYWNGLALDRGLGWRRAEMPPSARVFGASAGAAAYRRAALDDAGGFPDAFFMYLEDVDLAWRLRLRGWEAVHVADAVVRHDYSGSSGEGSPLKRRLLARNRVWCNARCLPGWMLRRHWWRVIAYDIVALTYALAKRDSDAVLGRLAGLMGIAPRFRERWEIQGRAVAASGDLAALLLPPPPARELVRLRDLTSRLAASGSARGTGEPASGIGDAPREGRLG